jgi:hypothetical protein
VINAGGSFGQFVFAPILQKLIQGMGWMGAMWAMAVMTLAALPLVGKLTRPVDGQVHHVHEEGGLKRAIGEAMTDRSYLLLHAGFFTCGFHIAFLVTHLPGEVNLCGCRLRLPAGRWPSSGWPIFSAVCMPAPVLRNTAANTCWPQCMPRVPC